MRWVKVRRAELGPEWRKGLETTGVEVVRLLVAQNRGVMFVDGKELRLMEHDGQLVFAWLVEQAQREERKETWSLAMEVSITVLVLLELIVAVYALVKYHAG